MALDGCPASRLMSTMTEILKILIRDETLSPDIDLKKLAKQTETFSGSDLKRKSLFNRYSIGPAHPLE